MRETPFLLTNGRYQEEAGHRRAQHKREKLAQQLEAWCSRIPTVAATSVQDVLQPVTDVFRGPFLAQLMDLHCSPRWLHMARATYIGRQQVVHAACVQLAAMAGTDGVVCVGAARFPTRRMRGYAPSPQAAPFLQELRRMGARVLLVPEWNTSLVGSNCLVAARLANMEPSRDVAKPHFVRRCTNTECRTVWQRDVNAARNMAMLGRAMVRGQHGASRPMPFVVGFHLPVEARTPVQQRPGVQA
jgi:hypothetical protein